METNEPSRTETNTPDAHQGRLICGLARHQSIKASDTRWRTETSPAGILGGAFELRHCVACGTTLGRAVR